MTLSVSFALRPLSASACIRPSENTKNPMRIAPDTPTPATMMNGSAHPGVCRACSSDLRRPRAAAASSITVTKTKTAVATTSIGHQMPTTERAAGPFGLTIDDWPEHPPLLRTTALTRTTGAADPCAQRTRPVDTGWDFPAPVGSKPAFRGTDPLGDRRGTGPAPKTTEEDGWPQ